MEGKKIKLETIDTVEIENTKQPSVDPSYMPIKVKSEISSPDICKKLMDMQVASQVLASNVFEFIKKKLESFAAPLHRDQLQNQHIKSKSVVPPPNSFEQWLAMESHKIYDANVKDGMKRTYEEHLNTYSLKKSHHCYNKKGDSSSHAPSNSKKAAEPRNCLVAVGCRACYIYWVVGKGTKECPKCGGELIHFDKGKSPKQ